MRNAGSCRIASATNAVRSVSGRSSACDRIDETRDQRAAGFTPVPSAGAPRPIQGAAQPWFHRRNNRVRSSAMGWMGGF